MRVHRTRCAHHLRPVELGTPPSWGRHRRMRVRTLHFVPRRTEVVRWGRCAHEALSTGRAYVARGDEGGLLGSGPWPGAVEELACHGEVLL